MFLHCINLWLLMTVVFIFVSYSVEFIVYYITLVRLLSNLPCTGVEMLAYCLQQNPESHWLTGVTIPGVGQQYPPEQGEHRLASVSPCKEINKRILSLNNFRKLTHIHVLDVYLFYFGKKIIILTAIKRGHGAVFHKFALDLTLLSISQNTQSYLLFATDSIYCDTR